jgi:membrane-associated phospholipid phosphatase
MMSTATVTMPERTRRTRRLRPAPIAGNLLALAVLLVAAELLPRLAPHHDLATALANARRIADLQSSLGVPSERGLAGWLNARAALRDTANVAYVGLHVPVMAATLCWLYVTRPAAFRRTRALFVAAMVLTVAGYCLLPTAPPRFLPGADDGAGALYGSAAGPSGDDAVNALAAFPSGHVVFALVAALAVVANTTRLTVRALAAAYPAFVALLVVATGHHFWTDVIAGGLVVAVAAAAVRPVRARTATADLPSR